MSDTPRTDALAAQFEGSEIPFNLHGTIRELVGLARQGERSQQSKSGGGIAALARRNLDLRYELARLDRDDSLYGMRLHELAMSDAALETALAAEAHKPNSTEEA